MISRHGGLSSPEAPAPGHASSVPDMAALPLGIRRVTVPLPTRPGHVHCYLVPGDDGWTIVDTGIALPEARERWEAELSGLDGPVARMRGVRVGSRSSSLHAGRLPALARRAAGANPP